MRSSLGRPGGRLIPELGSFGVIGVINSVLDIAVFNLLLFGVFEHEPWAAKAISTTVSATTSYFMNRHWTWHHRARTGTRRELTRFLLISGLALGITEVCLVTSHYVLGFTSRLDDNIAANLVGLGLATIFRFWAFKKFVFLRPDTAPDGATAPSHVPSNRARAGVDAALVLEGN